MTIRYIAPFELLELADELAGRNAGRGKPRTVWLRRATSSAYYALFHELSHHTVQRLVGDGWSEEHANVARWITHTDLRVLSTAVLGSGNAALRQLLAESDERLQSVADAFIRLQDARHDADYNDLVDVTRFNALSHVDTARSAVDTAGELFREQNGDYQKFLGLALGGVKVAKSR